MIFPEKSKRKNIQTMANYIKKKKKKQELKPNYKRHTKRDKKQALKKR